MCWRRDQERRLACETAARMKAKRMAPHSTIDPVKIFSLVVPAMIHEAFISVVSAQYLHGHTHARRARAHTHAHAHARSLMMWSAHESARCEGGARAGARAVRGRCEGGCEAYRAET